MRKQPCPKGAVEVYEVFILPGTRTPNAYAKRQVLFITEDLEEAKREVWFSRAQYSRRFAVKLPNGLFYLLSSVYPCQVRRKKERPHEVPAREHSDDSRWVADGGRPRDMPLPSLSPAMGDG